MASRRRQRELHSTQRVQRGGRFHGGSSSWSHAVDNHLDVSIHRSRSRPLPEAAALASARRGRLAALCAAYLYPGRGDILLGVFTVLCSLTAAARAIQFHARFVTDGPALESDTRVWIRRKGKLFARPRAGVLHLADGTLSFKARKGDVSFSFPVSELDPRFRKLSYGTGFEFKRDGLKYAVSFLEPEGGRDPFELLAMPLTMWSGRRIGTTWRAALAAAT